jgi:O-antigen ligase
MAKIGQSPIIGYGRAAVERTGLKEQFLVAAGDTVRNPHNAYLELLLDSGSLGLVAVLAFYLSIAFLALSLLRDRRNPAFAAVGGVAAALLITFLVGSLTGESFYPREGTLGMWCAIGLLVRVGAQRARHFPHPDNLYRATAPLGPWRVHGRPGTA